MDTTTTPAPIADPSTPPTAQVLVEDAPAAAPVPTDPPVAAAKTPKTPKKAKTMPKTPKAPKAAKAAPPAEKPTTGKDAPSSGQSGPALKLKGADVNKTERKVLGVFAGKGRPSAKTIGQMAEGAFPTLKVAQANSWTRNSLRRLVRAGFLTKLERGRYVITAAGRAALKE
jgi:hypothetical protein